MKDFLIRLSENADGVAKLLSLIDRNSLAGGRLIVTPRMLEEVFKVLTSGELRFGEVSVADNGAIQLTAIYGGMTLAYTLRIEHFSVANGVADGVISYTEQRRGGGLGGALLGITGKSGLAVALAKQTWIKVGDREITVSSRSLPTSLRASFLSASRSGLVFRLQ